MVIPPQRVSRNEYGDVNMGENNVYVEVWLDLNRNQRRKM